MDLETLKKFTEKGIPFNDFLGFQVLELREGFAQIKVPTRTEFIGDVQRPALHGGLISTLADSVGGVATFTQLENDQRASTVDMRIDFLRPGNVDAALIGEGHVLRLGNRVAVTEMRIHQGDPENPIAIGSAVYNVVRIRSK